MSVSIIGLDKAAVLAALYNGAKPQGAGFIHYNPTPMTVEEARTILAKYTSFDYLKGRAMKVEIEGDEIDETGYDRNNGKGACEGVIDELRFTDDPNTELIERLHLENTRDAALDTLSHLGDEASVTLKDSWATASLGLSDLAEFIKPGIDKVLGDDSADADAD